jgi:hypothetical protein
VSSVSPKYYIPNIRQTLQAFNVHVRTIDVVAKPVVLPSLLERPMIAGFSRAVRGFDLIPGHGKEILGRNDFSAWLRYSDRWIMSILPQGIPSQGNPPRPIRLTDSVTNPADLVSTIEFYQNVRGNRRFDGPTVPMSTILEDANGSFPGSAELSAEQIATFAKMLPLQLGSEFFRGLTTDFDVYASLFKSISTGFGYYPGLLLLMGLTSQERARLHEDEALTRQINLICGAAHIPINELISGQFTADSKLKLVALND